LTRPAADAGGGGAKRPPWGRIFRTSLILIPLGVIGNVVFTFLATDREILASLGAFPRQYLLLAVALALVPWVTNTLRLWIWTDFIGHRLRVREAFTVTLGTNLGAGISPTAVGGGVVKWGMLIQRGLSPGSAASLTTLTSVEDALFFMVAIPLAIFLTGAWDLPILRTIATQLRENLPLAMAVAAGLALVLWLLVAWINRRGRAQSRRGFWARLRHRIRSAWRDAIGVYDLIIRRGKGRFALSMTLVSVQWISRYSVITALVAFLGVPVDPVLFWLFQWVVFSLMVLIPTPGATVGAEATFALVYSALLPTQIIGVATAGWRFLTFYLQLTLAALIFGALNWRLRRAR
jgi:glycosyltransferase 2 family protein